jgi:predicted nuclease of predicted toxin-antitoxin system
MIRLLVDEDFNNDILRGLRRRVPDLDAPRVQAIGLAGAGDEAVLAHAAAENRVVLTHDVSTMVGLAYQRVRAGEQCLESLRSRSPCSRESRSRI